MSRALRESGAETRPKSRPEMKRWFGLDGFAGQALYIGPTFYATFGERYFVSAAWNVQVWGAVAGTSGALDLDNFERHHVKLRVGASF